jgi:hypothetical protein
MCATCARYFCSDALGLRLALKARIQSEPGATPQGFREAQTPALKARFTLGWSAKAEAGDDIALSALINPIKFPGAMPQA